MKMEKGVCFFLVNVVRKKNLTNFVPLFREKNYTEAKENSLMELKLLHFPLFSSCHLAILFTQTTNQQLNIATTYFGLVHMGTEQWTGL
jgi:hypothetical protein